MSHDKLGFSKVKDSRKTLLPALIAAGGGLAAAPAGAIEIGEISVQSRLGEPLRATIPYTVGPEETLAAYCISLQPALANSGLPAVNGARLGVTEGVITVTGRSVVREPLMALRLNVQCPYTPNLSREFMLFVDPPARAAITTAEPAPATSAAALPAPRPEARPNPVTERPAVRRTNPVTAPVEQGMRYRVQPGQSLSEIVQAIPNRDIALWPAVMAVFDANPDAFIDEDPNKLKAGSWLVIPEFVGTDVVINADPARAPAAAAEPVTEPATSVTEAADSNATAYPGISTQPVEAAAPAATTSEADPYNPAGSDSIFDSTSANRSIEPEAIDDTDMLEPANPPTAEGLQPGDIILDTEIEPAASGDSPNVPVATLVQAPDQGQSSYTWLLWLAGAGAALIAALFMFGRRRRDDEEPAPVAEPVHPMRRATDTATVEVIAEPQLEIPDDSPTEENLALDADLELGTGLSEGTDIDVAQDFGFAVTTHLDMELPEETPVDVEDTVPETDIIAPPKIDESSILESEVLPDDDDYDMSVIVDATKMPQPEEVTEMDLKAVVVENADETLVTDNYTVSQEVDYQILEQDYEDELTATQALNMEIERAAAEIAERMERDDDAPVEKTAEIVSTEKTVELGPNEKTAEMPLATVTELDVTANLPAGPDEDLPEDSDPTDLNKTIAEDTSDEKTVEMPRKDQAS